jgi:hypothetical protein
LVDDSGTKFVLETGNAHSSPPCGNLQPVLSRLRDAAALCQADVIYTVALNTTPLIGNSSAPSRSISS